MFPMTKRCRIAFGESCRWLEVDKSCEYLIWSKVALTKAFQNNSKKSRRKTAHNSSANNLSRILSEDVIYKTLRHICIKIFCSSQHHTKTLKIPRTHRAKHIKQSPGPFMKIVSCQFAIIYIKYASIYTWILWNLWITAFPSNLSIFCFDYALWCCETLCGSRDFNNSLNCFS